MKKASTQILSYKWKIIMYKYNQPKHNREKEMALISAYEIKYPKGWIKSEALHLN